MSKYGKKNYGCLKYFLFAVAIIGFMTYIFIGIAPKTFQKAKEEAIQSIFGVTLEDTLKADTVKPKDSVIVSPIPQKEIVKEKADSSVITVPVQITDHSVHVMAKVNGVDMKFLIDTGCSDMQITSAEFFYMKHLDLISDSEIIDRVTCVYADNRSGECPVIKIKTINIGGIEVKDIKCTVQENGESSLLLGQSVLKQLGEISIDYNNNQLKIRR